MITFESITIKNFLSFGNVPTTIPLNVPGTTLIVGENLDDTNRGSTCNGTGKTTIINALVYAVYDKPISNITKDNLVNNTNKKHMEVTITFSKSGNQYVIKRFRKKKAGSTGNSVQFFENGKDISQDNAHTNAKICEVIGIPYELFIRIVTFPATLTPFLNLPLRSSGNAANQTDIIEELFDLKILSEKANRLKDEIKSSNTTLDILLAKDKQIQHEAQRHEEQIKNAEARITKWEHERQAEIKSIKHKLESIQEIDIEEQKRLKQQKDQVKFYLQESTNEQFKLNSVFKQTNDKIQQITQELESLKNNICPFCGQVFNDSKEKQKIYSQKLIKYSETLETTKIQLNQANNEILQLKKLSQSLSQKTIVQDLDQLISIQSQSDTLANRLTELQQSENPYQEPYQELLNMKLDPPDTQAIDELNDTITHQQFLLKLLTKRDSFVRKTLLDKNISFLNTRLAYYLKELGLAHSVQFTPKMTAQISQFSRVLDFGNLSNGQQARVNLALAFAFRDVLQSMHDYINICMLDEVLDVGLDTVGVESAANMLKQKTKTENISIYIISHRDEIDNTFDRKITVQMTNGFSNIVYE